MPFQFASACSETCDPKVPGPLGNPRTSGESAAALLPGVAAATWLMEVRGPQGVVFG